MGTKTKKGEVTSVQEKQNVFEAIPNLEPASLRGCIKTACGGYIRTFQGVPKSLPKKEVHLLGLKHLNTAVLSQVPTRQTLSPNVPDRIKIALLKQEYENQKRHLAMKDNYTDFREKRQIKDEELLRTNTELSKSTADKGMMKELLVEEQKLTRQLQEDGRKQQAVVEELLRKDLWNREQKLLRGAVKKKNPGVIQHLRNQVIKEEGVLAKQDMQEPQHLGKLLLRKQEYIEEQQITALGNCQLGTGMAGSPGTGTQRFQTQHFPIRAVFLPLDFKSPELFFGMS